MVGGIIGEPLDDFVNEEILRRQAVQGANSDERDTAVLNYMNNRNPWIKLASGVSLDSLSRLTDVTKGQIGTTITREIAKNYSGKKLAKNFVLFNTISSLGQSYQFRAGVKKTKDVLDLFAAYGGIGGSNQGLQPVPGIQNVDIKTKNRGSIREAVVKLKAYNQLQFSIIELLYLRLGYTMMLEFGFDKYILVEKSTLPRKFVTKDVGNTIIENRWFRTSGTSHISMLNQIERYRDKYNGNYDGFMGKVSNFDWTYNPDGSYDITLKLITVGDVIESLVTNVGFKGLDGTALFNLKAQYAQFTSDYQYGIGQTSFNPNPENELKPNSEKDQLLMIDVASTDAITNFLFVNSITLKKGVTKGDFYNIRDAAFKQYGGPVVRQVPPFKNYYVRLGKLLSFISNEIMTKHSGEDGNSNPILEMDLSTTRNLVSAYIDQVSCDPRVCIINPIFSKEVAKSFGKQSGKAVPPLFLDSKLQEFTVQQSGVVFGRLMNVYMNNNFVLDVIKKSKNNKDQITLFKFLQRICNGINKALGSVNNIEPVIKDDKTIVLIDQNPIPGLSKIAKSIGLKDFNRSIAPINVYGYGNKDDSNFLKNISFNTKIGPDLASLITISSTAGGKNKTKSYEATAFQKWNDGLSDRFNKEMSEPEYKPKVESVPIDNTQNVENAIDFVKGQRTQTIYSTTKTYLETYPQSELATLIGNDPATLYNSKDFKLKKKMEGDHQPTKFLGYTVGGFVFPASQYPDTDEGLRNFQIDAYKKLQQKAADDLKNEELRKQSVNTVKGSYFGWLVQAFGGKTSQDNNLGTNIKVTGQSGDKEDKTTETQGQVNESTTTTYSVNADNCKYFNFKTGDFYSRGKKAFKEYINAKINEQFNKTNTPGNTIGFIPIEFNLKLEGISGFKIYNALVINQFFLPPQYPKALTFLIQGLSQKIDDKGWTTDLKTLSVPRSKPDSSIQIADQLSADDLVELENSLPEPPVEPVVNSDSYTAAGGTFTVDPPSSIDVTSPSGFSTLTKNKDTGKNQIVAGNKNKYLKYVGDIDKTPGLKRIFFDDITMKTSVIIHHTAGWSYGKPNPTESSIEGWTERAVKNNYPVATHYVISQNGHVELVFNEAFWSYHGSIGTQDKYTIGIELQGLGYMKKRTQKSDGSIKYDRGDLVVDQSRARKYINNSFTSTGTINVDDLFSRPVNAAGEPITFRRYEYYQKYPPEQLQALEKVLRGIKQRHPQINFTYDYDTLFPKKPLYSASTANLKNRSGVYTHNTFTSKSDVFPQLELLQLLKRLGTELGPSKPLPNGQFYGQNGNFTVDNSSYSSNIAGTSANNTSSVTPANEEVTAWSIKLMMCDVADIAFEELKSESTEFGGKYIAKEKGDRSVLRSEVGRLYQSKERLKKTFKRFDDDEMVRLFHPKTGVYKGPETLKKFCWTNMSDERWFGRSNTFTGIRDGYDTPNYADSDLEERWETVTGKNF